MSANRVRRALTHPTRGHRALETTETACRGPQIRPGARSGRGRDVTIVATMDLDRLQVHSKWEMSIKRWIELALVSVKWEALSTRGPRPHVSDEKCLFGHCAFHAAYVGRGRGSSAARVDILRRW